MSAAGLGRVLWKEYRTLRQFWVGLAVLAAVPQLIAVFFFDGPKFYDVERFLVIGVVATVLYGLVVGAALFAGERESGSYDFLRLVPCSLRRLLWGKVVFAGVSTLALLAVLSALAMALCGGELPSLENWRYASVWWGGITLQFFAWGAFFSLWASRPILAVVLGAVAALWTISRQHENATVLLISASCLLTLDVALAVFWFRRDLAPDPGGFLALPQEFLSDLRRLVQRPGRPPSARRRLVWQDLRYSWRTLLVLGAVAVLILGLWPARRHLVADSAVLAAGLAFLLGVSAFFSDQWRQRYRFFAEQGVRPGDVWLSRQALWGVLLVVWMVAAAFVSGLDYSGRDHIRHGFSWWGLFEAERSFAVYALLAYSAGQLGSMFFTKQLLAVFFGGILAALLCAWAHLMAALEVPWIWSVLPLPAVLLLASWIRASSWILERGGWRGWLVPDLLVGGALVAVFTGAAVYRLTEIPVVTLEFPSSSAAAAQPTSEEALRTAELYREAQLGLKPRREYSVGSAFERPHGRRLTGSERSWLEDNQTALALVTEASQRSSCAYWAGADPWTKALPLEPVLLLVAEGKRLEDDGQLDQAFEFYRRALQATGHLRNGAMSNAFFDLLESRVYDELPLWAARPGQTPERIRGVVAELEAFAKRLPDPKEALVVAHRETIERFQKVAPKARYRSWTDGWKRWMPWERARTLRIYDQFMAEELRHLVAAQSALTSGSLPPKSRRRRLNDWLQRMDPALKDLLPQHPGYAGGRLLVSETHRRAVRIVLALQAWRLEHGALPETLGRFVGEALDDLPLLDPYTGSVFDYYPEGSPKWKTWVPGKHVLYKGAIDLPSSKPFLFCSLGGPGLSDETLASDDEVTLSGWVFPIVEPMTTPEDPAPAEVEDPSQRRTRRRRTRRGF